MTYAEKLFEKHIDRTIGEHCLFLDDFTNALTEALQEQREVCWNELSYDMEAGITELKYWRDSILNATIEEVSDGLVHYPDGTSEDDLPQTRK